MADAAKQFTQEYKSFATAVDTTRHELRVNNFYIDGDRMTFLGLYFSVQFATLLESEENLGVSWIYLLCIGSPLPLNECVCIQKPWFLPIQIKPLLA